MCVMWVPCPHYPQHSDTAVCPVATAGNLLRKPTEQAIGSQRRDFIVSGCSENPLPQSGATRRRRISAGLQVRGALTRKSASRKSRLRENIVSGYATRYKRAPRLE